MVCAQRWTNWDHALRSEFYACMEKLNTSQALPHCSIHVPSRPRGTYGKQDTIEQRREEQPKARDAQQPTTAPPQAELMQEQDLHPLIRNTSACRPMVPGLDWLNSERPPTPFTHQSHFPQSHGFPCLLTRAPISVLFFLSRPQRRTSAGVASFCLLCLCSSCLWVSPGPDAPKTKVLAEIQYYCHTELADWLPQRIIGPELPALLLNAA